MTKRSLATPLSLIAMLALGGCAGEDDIDRTQANRLPKSMFSGTWYVRSTVIGVPGTSTTSWIGRTGATEKIRWEIQEDWLIAYRAYQEVPGTDSANELATDPAEYKENPIAAFPIADHFDIKRDYNASTGEQTNVIGENTTDRPWHERDWIRVDWANSDVDEKAFWGAGGKVDSNVQFFVQPHEEGNLDAMRVIGDDGSPIDFESMETVRKHKADSWENRVAYFDMVGRFVLEPETVKLRYGSQTYEYPLCWFISYRGRNFQTVSCGPTENRIRTSFMKVKQRNFEPVELPNREMGKFGYFRQERFSYDRRYGLTETGRLYLARVHNIWEKAYETNEDGSFKLGDDGKYVRIPLKDRVPKPLTYYVNENFPCELVGTAKDIAASWNHSFRRTVAVAKGLLTKTDGDTSNEKQAIPNHLVPEMLRLDTNGWTQKSEGDDWSCENLVRDESRVTARLGDLRYNFMAWVPDRQMTGPLGYGPSSADPETGETVAGMAYVYGAAIDTYANSALEIIRVLNGDLEINDLISADHVREYIGFTRPQIEPAKIPEKAAALRGAEIGKKLLPASLRQKLADVRALGVDALAVGKSTDPFERLEGSELAKYLLDEEIVRGVAPALVPDKSRMSVAELMKVAKEELAPTNWASDEAIAMDRERMRRAAEQSLWLAEFSDDSIQGLAEEIWKKYGETKDYEAMWQHLRKLIFRGVMEHEVGHTLGLRHNFSGSFDSVNYFNEYWKLREQPDEEGNGGLIERDPHQSESGQLTLKQLYAQAKQTKAQIAGRMREYQYSSIMDYHSKFNSDTRGIGKYDQAAILFGYAGYVEVFEKMSPRAKAVLRQRYSDCQARYESIPNPAYDYLLEQWHYSSVWNLLGKAEGMANRRFRAWDAVKQQQGSATEQCKELVAQGEKVSDFVDREDTKRDAEVQYMFCSDEYAGATQSCQRWDEGADPFEQVANVVNSYNAYYFFNNFKRDRFGFDAYTNYRRALSRFSKLKNTYQHWLFETQFNDVQDVTQGNYWTAATLSGFNLLTNVLAMPQYGTYCRFDENTGKCAAEGPRWGLVSSSTADPGKANRIVVDQGVGRRRFSRYDYESGYDYQYQILETGHFWENLAAINVLTSESGTFIGREIASDFTRYLVPYYLTFEDELTRIFEGVVNQNYDAYAPRIVDGKLATRTTMPWLFGSGDDKERIDPFTGATLADTDEGQVIDMQNWFTLRYYTLIMGMSKFRALYSLRYADRQQVFRVGSGDEVTPSDGKELFSCHDPIGGHVYGTVRDPSIDDEKQTAAVDLVRTCQEQVQAYLDDPDSNSAEQDVNNTVEWLNFMRGLYGFFGSNVQ